MPDLSAAAAHLRQEARENRDYVDREKSWLPVWTVREVIARADRADAVAGLLEAIAGGHQPEIEDCAGAVAAVVVPTTEEKP